MWKAPAFASRAGTAAPPAQVRTMRPERRCKIEGGEGAQTAPHHPIPTGGRGARRVSCTPVGTARGVCACVRASQEEVRACVRRRGRRPGSSSAPTLGCASLGPGAGAVRGARSRVGGCSSPAACRAVLPGRLAIAAGLRDSPAGLIFGLTFRGGKEKNAPFLPALSLCASVGRGRGPPQRPSQFPAGSLGGPVLTGVHV